MACPRDKPLCRISAVEAAIFEPEGEDPLLVLAKSGVISIQVGPSVYPEGRTMGPTGLPRRRCPRTRHPDGDIGLGV